MGRFETKWLSRPENLAALADLPGQWIDKVHTRRQPKTIVLDLDSSESLTYGEQEGSAYNGHFGRTCYHPLFVCNQLGDNFMRTLAMPKTAEPWSLTSLREELIKIGAKVVSHGRYVTFQMAEVALPRQMFKNISRLIAQLRAPPAPA